MKYEIHEAVKRLKCLISFVKYPKESEFKSQRNFEVVINSFFSRLPSFDSIRFINFFHGQLKEFIKGIAKSDNSTIWFVGCENHVSAREKDKEINQNRRQQNVEKKNFFQVCNQFFLKHFAQFSKNLLKKIFF